jgi:hypothetical protein
MSVDVAETIVAPVSESLMWTQESGALGHGVGVMAAPAVGWTTITTAGEEGRLLLATATVGLGADPPGEVQATTRIARAANAARAAGRGIGCRTIECLMRS